jgi:hypothetical protein
MTRRLLIAVAVLLSAHTTFAQFGQSNLNRLTDLAARLSRDANDFADANYRNYSNSFRTNRSDVEVVMLSQQFGAASQVFYKMANDRRRNQELRDAFGFVQELARSIDRTNVQRNNWNSIQRSLTDIGREIDSGGSNDGDYPDQGRGGRITWKGRVDDNVRIVFRGGTADLETVGGTPYSDAQPNFINSLPARRVVVTLTVKRGRGNVYIEQQPSRENDFACIIRIRDTKGGADNYEFELSW